MDCWWHCFELLDESGLALFAHETLSRSTTSVVTWAQCAVLQNLSEQVDGMRRVLAGECSTVVTVLLELGLRYHREVQG